MYSAVRKLLEVNTVTSSRCDLEKGLYKLADMREEVGSEE